MNGKASSIRSAVSDFMLRNGIPGEMEQNLVKEAIHLHLLSALSDAGVLSHVVFQGGTALRLCYGGERYSEDLDFVCGKSASEFASADFESFIRHALESAKQTLQKTFDIDAGQISVRQHKNPLAIKSQSIAVVAWQIIVPIDKTAHSPKSLTKIEFANVPAYDKTPGVARAAQNLVQIQDVILTVESAKEILADKAVALVAREVLKHRDIWDVWDLAGRLKAPADRDMARRKFVDYGTGDVENKARRRIDELMSKSTADSFLQEMRRFLPAKRVAELSDSGLHRAILAESRSLIEKTVLQTT